jgi:hypothetical protein
MTFCRLLIALALTFAAHSAMAQTTAAADAAIPKNPCVKPDHYPGKKAQDTRKDLWQTQVTAWGDCVRKYTADLRAHVDATVKVANSAIEEYNVGIKELQDEQRAANE